MVLGGAHSSGAHSSRSRTNGTRVRSQSGRDNEVAGTSYTFGVKISEETCVGEVVFIVARQGWTNRRSDRARARPSVLKSFVDSPLIQCVAEHGNRAV